MIKICGVGESQFETELQPFLSSLPDTLQSAYLPVFGEVWFYLYSYQKNHQVIQSAEIYHKKNQGSMEILSLFSVGEHLRNRPVESFSGKSA